MTAILLAAALLLAWESDRTAPVQPDAFLITALHDGHTETLRVAPSAPGACDALPRATADTFCAQWPGPCPADGVYTITIQGLLGEQRSAPSAPQVCVLSQAVPCECLALEASALVLGPEVLSLPAPGPPFPTLERPTVPVLPPAVRPPMPTFPVLTLRANAAGT